jgi:hypothetical protein
MSGRCATERQALDDVRDLDDAARDAAGTEGRMQRLSTTSRPGASPQPGRRPASSGASTTARRPQGSLDSPPAAGSGLRRDHPSRRSRRLSCSRTSDHLNRYCPPGGT